jgi:hypothetical protein
LRKAFASSLDYLLRLISPFPISRVQRATIHGSCVRREEGDMRFEEKDRTHASIAEKRIAMRASKDVDSVMRLASSNGLLYLLLLLLLVVIVRLILIRSKRRWPLSRLLCEWRKQRR